MGTAPAVAHYMDRYLGLTETFIHEYLAAFRRVRPVVIASRFENLAAFPLPDGSAIHRARATRGTPRWAWQAMVRRVRGGEPHIERLLAREGVRLIHAHFGPAACRLLEVRRRTGLPLVTSFYGYDASITDVTAAYSDLYRRLFDLGDAFLAEGPAMARKLEALGCPSSRIRIQRIAIDTRRYRCVPREDPGKGAVVLLLCGRMVPKKGHETALRALAEARRVDPRLTLRLAGDGPERVRLESLIRELALAGQVTLLGNCSRDTLAGEMERAHIYVQPSRIAPDGDSEGGAPTALLEAQASGLPVLATRHADIPYVVREHDTALLCPEGDVAGLAENMVTLARDPARWGPMGRAGRAFVEEHHDIGRLAKDLEVFYATLAETGRISRSDVVISGTEETS